MAVERAGQPAQPGDLVDVPHLVTAYYTTWPDVTDPAQRVAFGTSGHRGSSLTGAFTEAHIVATTQAICDYRARAGHRRPALHGPRHARPLRAGLGLGARGAGRQRRRPCWSTAGTAYTPTPAVSHAILVTTGARRTATARRADGIVVTPSHNPPTDGGFKYNPPHGGPADTDATAWIANRANELPGRRAARRQARVPLARAARRGDDVDVRLPRRVRRRPAQRIDLDAVREAGRARSAPTRWAARAWTTGGRSPSATGSTSPWSTRWSTRPGGS